MRALLAVRREPEQQLQVRGTLGALHCLNSLTAHKIGAKEQTPTAGDQIAKEEEARAGLQLAKSGPTAGNSDPAEDVPGRNRTSQGCLIAKRRQC